MKKGDKVKVISQTYGEIEAEIVDITCNNGDFVTVQKGKILYDLIDEKGYKWYNRRKEDLIIN